MSWRGRVSDRDGEGGRRKGEEKKAATHLSMSYCLRYCVAATVVKAQFCFRRMRAGGREGSTARSGSPGSARACGGSEKTRGPFWRKIDAGRGASLFWHFSWQGGVAEGCQTVSFQSVESASWRLAPPTTPTSCPLPSKRESRFAIEWLSRARLNNCGRSFFLR